MSRQRRWSPGWEINTEFTSKVPRKILAGLQPGLKEERAHAAARARIEARWEEGERHGSTQ